MSNPNSIKDGKFIRTLELLPIFGYFVGLGHCMNGDLSRGRRAVIKASLSVVWITGIERVVSGIILNNEINVIKDFDRNIVLRFDGDNRLPLSQESLLETTSLTTANSPVTISENLTPIKIPALGPKKIRIINKTNVEIRVFFRKVGKNILAKRFEGKLGGQLLGVGAEANIAIENSPQNPFILSGEHIISGGYNDFIIGSKKGGEVTITMSGAMPDGTFPVYCFRKFIEKNTVFEFSCVPTNPLYMKMEQLIL